MGTIVTISGVFGSGKTTLMEHFYLLTPNIALLKVSRQGRHAGVITPMNFSILHSVNSRIRDYKVNFFG